MYACGPTVYNNPHIGNLRRYITDDVLLRYLKYEGFKVRHIMNITDVGHLTQDNIDQGEDKFIVAARREGKSPLAIAQHYTKVFMDDIQKLNIIPADQYTKATDHIPEMQDMINKLLEKKHAYEVNGSVYYDVASFPEYGKLSGNTLDELREKVRPELSQEAFAEKKSPEDFALWIKAAPDHLLQWDSPWSKGYPNWPIECAAMINKHVGGTVDIHSGGEDNIFPHHEAEIAETQAVTGKPLANYWFHTRHLFINGKKMAKSGSGLVLLRDIEKRGFHPLAFRFLVLGANFMSHVNFTWDAMQAAQEGWERVQELVNRLRENGPNGSPQEATVTASLGTKLDAVKKAFLDAIANNLNTAKALSALSQAVTIGNNLLKKDSTLADRNAVLEHILDFDSILGILDTRIEQFLDKEEYQKLLGLLVSRNNLRTDKKFKEADAVRKKLIELGFEIQDTGDGVRWLKKATAQHGFIRKEDIVEKRGDGE